jgi:signal transduction histidine kinase
MMFRSINSRLLLTYMTLIGVILLIVTLSLVAFLVRNPRLAREAESGLLLAANALNRQQIGNIQFADQASLDRAAEEADALLDVRVALLSPDGAVLTDSRADTEEALPAQAIAMHGQGAEIAEFEDSQGQGWIYTTRNLPRRMVLVVAAEKPRAPLFSFFTDELFPPIWRAGFLALLFSLVLAFFMARWITAPLKRVSEAAQELASGQMRTIEPEGPAEVQSLANTFNEMGSKVVASQQAQKDFVANVSHELRTPLTSIQGYAQAIADGTASSKESVKNAAQIIYDEAGRMYRLVANLLDLARLDANAEIFQFQTVAIEEMLKEVVGKLSPIASAQGVAIKLAGEKAIKVSGDRDRLVQVFTNIIENAIKHSPKAGEVRIAAASEKGIAKIAVSDQGAGIAPKEAQRIFERFYQIDKSRKSASGRGTGLGLPIAKQIVEAHKGTIRVDSKPGRGSTFTVELPLTR